MKKSYPFMLSLGLAALSLTANAQTTDVTSQYLKNADFEGSYSIQTEYQKGDAKNYRAIYLPADWTMNYTGGEQNDISVLKSGDLQYSSIESKAGGALDASRFGSQTYRLRYRWGTEESIDLHQKVLLPAGYYQLSADVFGNANGNMYIYAGETKSANVTSGKWTNVTITFQSNGTDSITLGVAFPRSSKGQVEQVNGVDNFKLLVYATYKGKLTDAITSATTANGTLNNSDLADAITKAQTVADNANATQTEIDEAASFVTNMVTYAKAVALITTEDLPYASSDKLIALQNAKKDVPTTADDALTKATAITTAARAYVESNSVAEGVSGATSYTTSITNPNAESKDGWTLSQHDGNASLNILNKEPFTDAEGNSQYNYFDASNWNGNDWTTRFQQDIKDLPAGKYLLAVTARGSNDLRWEKLYGGNKEANITHIGADADSGIFGRGWNDTYLVFTTNGTDAVTIGVTANAQKKYQWHSFSRFRLTRIADLDKVTISEDDAAAPAASSDYQDVVLSRSFNANAWNTLVLPYDVSAANVTAVFGANAKVANFTGATVADGTYTLSFTTSTDGIKANTPVLIYGVDSKNEFTFSSVKMNPAAAAVTIDEVSFTGSYTPATLPAGSFFLSSDNKIYKATGSEQAKGTRAFFTLPAASSAKAVTMLVNGKTTTGIGMVSTKENDAAPVFNLAGQRVQRNAKGLVIVGGKKVIRK